MDLPKKDSSLILILCLIFLVSRLPVMLYLPMIQDECLYSMMIEEQAHHLTLIPTFLGYPVSWKPPLFFWSYVFPTRLPLPLEAAFRYPSFIFGLATVPVLFNLFRNAGISGRIAFLTILVHLLTVFTIYPDSTVLVDSMAFFLICLSLIIYSSESFGRLSFLGQKIGSRRFLIAGALAFAAFYVKLVLAFMVPVLAIAFFLMKDRKVLQDRLFFFSLAAVPLAFITHYASVDSVGLAGEFYSGNIGIHVLGTSGLFGMLKIAMNSFTMMIITGGIIWCSLALAGFWKSWRSNIFMSVWLLISAFPICAASFLPWYYLPVMPAIAYFAVVALTDWNGQEKLDRFFWLIFCFLMLVVAVPTVIIFKDTFYTSFQSRDVGRMLTGKEGVLVIGDYAPGVVSYEVLPEIRSGVPIDYGWIIVPKNTTNATIQALIDDYYTRAFPVVDGSFSAMFTSDQIYRKDTNLTNFQVVAVIGPYDARPGGGTLIYNDSNVTVYEVK